MLPRLARSLQPSRVPSLPSVLRCTSARTLSSDKHPQPEEKPKSGEWSTIYKLPVIRWLAALNKLKIYQAGLTAAAIPATYAAESASMLSDGMCVAVSSLGITGTITLTIASYFAQNFIGFIYVDNTKTRFRIAYVDFWGKRRNVELQHDEIEPPEEDVKYGFVSTVKTSGKGSFRLLRRLGQVTDGEVFAYYFGE